MSSRSTEIGTLLLVASIAAVVLVATAAGANAGTLSLALDPGQTTIRWLLRGFPDTVHGTFTLERGQVSFDPATGAAGGCIRVDARSGASGNASRDRKMHDEILETARYPTVMLRPTYLAGSYPSSAGEELRLSGLLSLRGGEHPVTLSTRVATSGSVVTADATVTIPYVAWGLRDPSVFIFRASKTVELEIHAVGSLTTATGSTAPTECGP